LPTILVVDDHPDVVRLVRAALGKRYEVIGAANGEEALAMVADSRPSLILLDVMMPVLDGFRVLHRLKSDPETTDLPIIMLTGRDRDHDMALGLSLGADCYLTKPFDPRDLVTLIARHLEVGAGAPPPGQIQV